MYRRFIKPALDFGASTFLLLFNLPLLIPILIVNTIITKGKPFFFHQRPGMFERPVRIIKFRTILENSAYTEETRPRVTAFGLFLRRTSLDELPQLVNVLRGEMSLVGPRPLLTEYLTLYNKDQYKRLYVKPGLTGWAQVNGRNAISWEERFALDVYYVDHISFYMDIKILLLTIFKVLSTEGAMREGEVLCPRFRGNLTA